MIDWEGQHRAAKAALVLRYDNNAQQKSFGVNLDQCDPIFFPATIAGSGGYMLEGVCGHQLETLMNGSGGVDCATAPRSGPL